MSHYTYCSCGFGWDAALSAGTHTCTTWTTKDSGERQQFESGMVRDTQRSKVRYDLLYMPMVKRWAELMSRGAEKYGDNNWKKANSQEEFDRFRESAFRHFFQYVNNENNDEDHASAVIFNICGMEYVKEKLQNKKSS